MIQSLDVIFRPKSVTIIGASTQKGTLGREVFDKLLNSDFNGPVYPVNPKALYIHSVKAYPRISAIPDKVDLAVIIVRKELVLEIVKECAEFGVKGLVVLTAGFKETGQKGAELERKIVEIIKTSGIRMIGPNCMGVINTHQDIRLDATFAPTTSLPGNIGLVSQSGALGQTILEHAQELNLGVSMFASVGNKADVSGNDLLEYWHHDPSVQVILMYLESFGNPKKFIQLAREVSLKKPIIVVKSGRTSSGARAATSHTGALAGMDVAFDALFKQGGVIRAKTINEMFDIAMGMANLPLPKGNRVAIITNAGGPGIMAADACESNGLEVVELSEVSKSKLKRKLVPDASVNNPVDLLAGAQPDEFQFTLNEVLQDENVDSAIVIFVAPIITNPTEVAQKISQVAQQYDKPVLGCFMGVKGVATGIEELQRQRIPTYPFPESAARTLAAMVSYCKWQQKKTSDTPRLSMNKKLAQTVVESAFKQKREYLNDEEIANILTAYKIPLVQSKLCKNFEEILEASKKIGFPLALKVSSKDVIHKTEVGGVKVGLRTLDEVKKAYIEMDDSLRNHNIFHDTFFYIVQEMLHDGREVIMGIQKVPDFGALIMFGLGGIYVEVLRDVTFRISPLTDIDADEMIKEIKGLPILQGVRGEKSVAFETIKQVLLNLSQLSLDLPEIVEMDINPFMSFPESEKSKAVDARIRIARQE